MKHFIIYCRTYLVKVQMSLLLNSAQQGKKNQRMLIFECLSPKFIFWRFSCQCVTGRMFISGTYCPQKRFRNFKVTQLFPRVSGYKRVRVIFFAMWFFLNGLQPWTHQLMKDKSGPPDLGLFTTKLEVKYVSFICILLIFVFLFIFICIFIYLSSLGCFSRAIDYVLIQVQKVIISITQSIW